MYVCIYNETKRPTNRIIGQNISCTMVYWYTTSYWGSLTIIKHPNNMLSIYSQDEGEK